MKKIVRFQILLASVLALLAACDTVVDPRTGERTTRFTLPGTAANEASFQERWQRCIQFRSPSVCERHFGRRPLRGSAPAASGDFPEPYPDGHP